MPDYSAYFDGFVYSALLGFIGFLESMDWFFP